MQLVKAQPTKRLPTVQQWWNAAPGQHFHAYYLCLRRNYGMSAWDALQTARQNFDRFPLFFNNPVQALRESLGQQANVELRSV